MYARSITESNIKYTSLSGLTVLRGRSLWPRRDPPGMSRRRGAPRSVAPASELSVEETEHQIDTEEISDRWVYALPFR
jgi:hypothetical protein